MRLIRKVNAIIIQVRQFLYKLGNEYVGITGGWSSYSWTGSSGSWEAAAPTLNKESDLMSVFMPHTYSTGKSGVVRSNNRIDLTNVSKVRLTMNYALGRCSTESSGYQRIYIFVSSETSGSWATTDVAVARLLCVENSDSAESAANAVYELDVSSLSGSYYVCTGYVWRYQIDTSEVEILEVKLIA